MLWLQCWQQDPVCALQITTAFFIHFFLTSLFNTQEKRTSSEQKAYLTQALLPKMLFNQLVGYLKSCFWFVPILFCFSGDYWVQPGPSLYWIMAISNHKTCSSHSGYSRAAKSYIPADYCLSQHPEKWNQQLLVCPLRWLDCVGYPSQASCYHCHCSWEKASQYFGPSTALCLSFTICFGLFHSWDTPSSSSWETEVKFCSFWDGLN